MSEMSVVSGRRDDEELQVRFPSQSSSVGQSLFY